MMNKKLFSIFTSLLLSSSLFAIDGIMHDSLFCISSNVIDFSDDAIRENVIDGRSVTFSPLDLKVGDIFIDTNGHAKKVTNITINGKNISIDTVTPMAYEVFDAINIPDQSGNISDLIEEQIEQTPDLEEITGSRAQNNDLLNTLMPVSKCKVNINPTIKIPVGKVPPVPTTENFAALLQNQIDLSNNPEVQDEEKKIAKENISKIRQQYATLTKQHGVTINPIIRYQANVEGKDYTNFGFQYIKIHIDRHGTCKFWKWTTWTEDGKGWLSIRNDSALGFGLKLGYYGQAKFSYPIVRTPGVVGPYIGVFFNVIASANASVYGEMYIRKCITSNAQVTFNALMQKKSSNFDTQEWSPSLQQVGLIVAGNVKAGPAIRAGINAFGMDLLSLEGSGGISIDGNIGGCYTWKDIDLSHKPDNFSTDIYDKVTGGWAFIGDLSLNLYLSADFYALNNCFSQNIASLKYPLLRVNGPTLSKGFSYNSFADVFKY